MDIASARQLFIDIATRDVGKREESHNRAPWIKPYWPDSDYSIGYTKRSPYCAAALCHWLATLGRELAAAGELRKTLGMSLSEFERWRCKSAGAWRWLDWADKRGLKVFGDDHAPQKGDIMVFDISHIGLVKGSRRNRVATIEANTGPSGGRDGDGVWEKDREMSAARMFIQLFPA